MRPYCTYLSLVLFADMRNVYHLSAARSRSVLLVDFRGAVRCHNRSEWEEESLVRRRESRTGDLSPSVHQVIVFRPPASLSSGAGGDEGPPAAVRTDGTAGW